MGRFSGIPKLGPKVYTWYSHGAAGEGPTMKGVLTRAFLGWNLPPNLGTKQALGFGASGFKVFRV